MLGLKLALMLRARKQGKYILYQLLRSRHCGCKRRFRASPCDTYTYSRIFSTNIALNQPPHSEDQNTNYCRGAMFAASVEPSGWILTAAPVNDHDFTTGGISGRKTTSQNLRESSATVAYSSFTGCGQRGLAKLPKKMSSLAKQHAPARYAFCVFARRD